MSTKPDSSQIKFDTGTVQDVLDSAKPIADYTALRDYTGTATTVRITTPGIAGFFTRRGTTGLTDNGGTVIIDADGRAWERVFDGAVSVKWFGAVGDGVADDTVAINAAFASGLGFFVGDTGAVYAVSGQINISHITYFDALGCTFSATLSAGERLLNITAATRIRGLTLDFNDGYALGAISFPNADAGHLELIDVTVQNIYDLDTTSPTIPVRFNADRNEIRFDGLTLKNIKKRSNGTPTDSNGGIEGIYLFVETAEAIGGGGYMRNINIENIRTVDAGGADVEDVCNSIYFAYAAATNRSAKIVVENVNALDFGRRLFKTQCDDLFIKKVFAEAVTLPALVGLGLQDYDTQPAYNVRAEGVILRGAMRFGVACSVTDALLDGIDLDISLQGVTSPYGSNSFGVGVNADNLTLTNSNISSDIDVYLFRAASSYAGKLKNFKISDTTFVKKVSGGYFILMQETTGTAEIDLMTLQNLVFDASLFPSSISVGAATKSNGVLKASNITVIDSDGNANGGTALYSDGFSNVEINGYTHVNKNAASQVFRSMRFRTCGSVQLSSLTFSAKPIVLSASFENIGALHADNVYVNPLATYSLSLSTTTNARFANLRRDKVNFNDETSRTGSVFAQEFSTGTTAQRPSSQLSNGQAYWDSTIGKPIWWGGSVWKDATGATV